jgi:hypothetical protein
MILLGKRTHFKPSYCKLTLWRKHLQEKLIVTLLVKKFVVIYENIKFFTMFTKDRHWTQSTVTAYSNVCVLFLLDVLCIKSLEGNECHKSPKKGLYN